MKPFYFLVVVLVVLIQPSLLAAADVDDCNGRTRTAPVNTLQIIQGVIEERLRSNQPILMEDYTISPTPPAQKAFSDTKAFNIFLKIHEVMRVSTLYWFDTYTLAAHVKQELQANPARSLHETSHLFLHGWKLQDIEGWLAEADVIALSNILAIQYMYHHQLYPAALKPEASLHLADILLNHIVTNLQFRALRLTDSARSEIMTFPDLRRTYSALDQYIIESTNQHYAGHILILQELFKSGVTQSDLEKFNGNNKKLFQSCPPALLAFFEGREKELKDIDSYIEQVSSPVAARHAARRGEPYEIVLQKLANWIPPVREITSSVRPKTGGEKPLSRQERRQLERKKPKKNPLDLQNLQKKGLATLFITHEKACVQEMRAYFENARRLKRAEIEKVKRDKLVEKQRQIREAAATVATASPTTSAGLQPKPEDPSAGEGKGYDDDELPPLPKAKIKTRKAAAVTTQEADAKELVAAEAVDPHPIFAGSPDLVMLHRQLMGPYCAKFGSDKFKRLATAFVMEIRPGKGDHFGVFYTDALGKLHTVSMPERKAYGRGFFGDIQKFFRDTCHLDEAHVVLEE